MANEPIPMTELGLVANECANYCNDKDGLELWLSFAEVCFNKVTLNTFNSINTIQMDALNTPLYSGIVCAICSLVFFTIGYIHALRFLNDI